MKQDIIATLAARREKEDRCDVPIDFRFIDLLLRASRDPGVALVI